MRTALAFASIIASTFAHAEPLKLVKPEVEGSDSTEFATIANVLTRDFTKAEVSLTSFEDLDDENVTAFFPGGKFHRVSAVVVYPETRHAALLEFVAYTQDQDAIVLPLSGDHSEFASLLRFTNKKLRSPNDALAAGKAFATIYRLRSTRAPTVISREGGYSIRFPTSGSNDVEGGFSKVELNIGVDKGGNVHRAVMEINFAEAGERNN